ncbi:type II secretion system F family protein [Nocardia stercoris]|uniref:Type II secretion system protein GspF domain-containing protein n=1 Tax=Nocardia stercoris TaxID=2483361 RepID=A0A3M2KV12_9NOCA|nr:hypothetical protein [Nocardia stercoris]RMI29299.1 hypothetical protein EBN03_26570 [Nocardia stercoris]
MSAALIVAAAALLTVPVPVSRRRFRALFGAAPTRKALSRNTGVVGAVLAAVIAVWWGAGAGTAVALAAGTAWVRSRAARRQRVRVAERRALSTALAAVVAELRAGAHPSTAAQLAAAEADGDTARAFAVGAARGRLGGSAADGLRDPNAVVAAELARVADAWQVAENHGLPLAELLAAARADLVSRMRFHARTAAALAGARASAAVLAGLPLLGLALGEAMGAAPIRVLFGTPAGAVVLPLGVALACAGLLWTDLITRGSVS